MTPESVHYGLAEPLYEHRKTVLRAAFEKNPNRFKGKVPQPPKLPKAAWINPPSSVGMGV
jgi:putative transposase